MVVKISIKTPSKPSKNVVGYNSNGGNLFYTTLGGFFCVCTVDGTCECVTKTDYDEIAEQQGVTPIYEGDEVTVTFKF